MAGAAQGINPLLRASYGAAASAATLLARVVPHNAASKLGRTFAARRGLLERYRAFGAAGRERHRPLVWMHAPSVGEGLQALPLLHMLRQRRPDAQLAYTFFSPSAEHFARSLDVDFAEYLPFDTAHAADVALDALAPSALVFSKLDVWPTLAHRASDSGIATALLSATISEESRRLRGVGGALVRSAYQRLDRIGAIDSEHAQRFADAGVDRARISVTGDTRYDQVWSRASAVAAGTSPNAELAHALRSDRFTLVAGSTWPSDEKHLLAAWSDFRAACPSARLIIAPHELSASRLRALRAAFAALSLATAVPADTAHIARADVILLDRLGVLGDVYAVGDAAYVGGGFHGAGLHSVLEPAAFGMPVLMGPRIRGVRDARLLIESGGGLRCDDARTIRETLSRWADMPAERRAAGAAALETVRGQLGATERSYEIVSELLSTPRR